MSDPYIQELFAERIGGNQYGKSTAIYKFEKIKRAKKAAKEAKPNVDLIDMGVGEPDEMAFPIVVESLKDEATKPENRGYADNGGEEFKEAAAKYMGEVFGVYDIDSRTEVIHSLGSKTALSMVPACFINPGDYVLMTVPGYPVLGTHAKYLGGHVHNIKLKEDSDFLPDLDAVPAEIVAKAKILVLNYPNNPTGAVYTKEILTELIELARRHKLIVFADEIYSKILYDDASHIPIATLLSLIHI